MANATTNISDIEYKQTNTNEDNATSVYHYRNRCYDQMRPKKEPKFMNFVRNWEKSVGFVTPIKWKHFLLITLFHVVTIVWFSYTICFLYKPKWQSVLFAYVVSQMAGFGVTAGAHRYWAHRSYKAKLPLQIILVICYSIAGQISIYDWVRDHYLHHKFCDSAADPHDASRGFWFSHVGWLLMKKRPEVLHEGAKLDMSDITNDPLVRFHNQYFNLFKVAWCFVLPTLVPMAAWGERWDLAVSTQLLRYILTLNSTWSVNSFAHLWGNKPYNRNIMPSQNFGVSILAMGEGWHNYHHTFPWDYKAAELGYSPNLTTLLLDVFANIGWAYDLKVASPKLIRSVAKTRGDGTRDVENKKDL